MAKIERKSGKYSNVAPEFPLKFNELDVTVSSLKTSGCGLFTMHGSIIFHNIMKGKNFWCLCFERERERGKDRQIQTEHQG